MLDSAGKGGILSGFLRRGFWMLWDLFWLRLGCLLIFKRELAVFEHGINVFLDGVSLKRESIGHVLEFLIDLELPFEFEVRRDVFGFARARTLRLIHFISLMIVDHDCIKTLKTLVWTFHQIISLLCERFILSQDVLLSLNHNPKG